MEEHTKKEERDKKAYKDCALYKEDFRSLVSKYSRLEIAMVLLRTESQQ